MTEINENPTPRRNWVRVGNFCRPIRGSMVGEVLNIHLTRPIPSVTVRWSNGDVRSHVISTLTRVSK